MDYYDERMRCFWAIEAILQKNEGGVETDFLIYDLTSKYKIGEKTIVNRLHLLKKLGKIDIIDGVIAWKTMKTSRHLKKK